MTQGVLQHVQDRAADGLAGASGLLFGVSLTATLQVVQIIAGIVAIISGVCAAVYYVKKAKSNAP